jgi:hypothetical protein
MAARGKCPVIDGPAVINGPKSHESGDKARGLAEVHELAAVSAQVLGQRVEHVRNVRNSLGGAVKEARCFERAQALPRCQDGSTFSVWSQSPG